MLALYTGARASEVAQLKVSDVVMEAGVWCISFRKTADHDLIGNEEIRTRQKLKGKSSVRSVPIAQPLLDAGFLDFVNDAKKANHPRLFPHLPSGTSRETGLPNGTGYGNALTIQFSNFLKSRYGFEKGIVFHSFRHLFVTMLEEAEVPKAVIASMTGHSRKRSLEFPVMELHYSHTRPEILKQTQVAALAKFKPAVVLPKYRPGQFAKAYAPGVRMHP